jgi:hypothetical protein
METSCGAGYIKSGQLITKAFEETAVAVTNNGAPTEAWFHEYYQYANRLAVLNFLLKRCFTSVPARLVILCFYGERQVQTRGWICPANASEWQSHLAIVHAKLDMCGKSPLMQRVHHVFLPVNPNW